MALNCKARATYISGEKRLWNAAFGRRDEIPFRIRGRVRWGVACSRCKFDIGRIARGVAKLEENFVDFVQETAVLNGLVIRAFRNRLDNNVFWRQSAFSRSQG